MSFQPDDRVHLKLLGVRGTVVRIREDGAVLVKADRSDRELPWHERELEKLSDD